jgi:hypothetical protein
MSIQGFLSDRDSRLEQARNLERRDAAARSWMVGGISEAQRLLRFDGWVRLELDARIDWTWAGEQQARRIEQCRIELENLVLGLWRRGWMLDGKALAGHITDALDDMRGAQKAGRVRDFWPYFKAVVDRYVGLNAEEIREEAMSLGVNAGAIFRQLQRQSPTAPSLPELLARRRDETLREKLARERAKEAACKAHAGQLPLL